MGRAMVVATVSTGGCPNCLHQPKLHHKFLSSKFQMRCECGAAGPWESVRNTDIHQNQVRDRAAIAWNAMIHYVERRPPPPKPIR